MTRNLEPQSVLRSSDGWVPPITYTPGERGWFHIGISLSEEALAMLENLAESTSQPLEDVIGKAFLLYKAAVDAQRDGKAVGIAPSAEVLETEFVGFGGQADARAHAKN